MASIARHPLEIERRDPWAGVAETASAWAIGQGLSLRDAIVLVPFAQHLPLARRAFARLPGWMPRIETTQTLARSLAPSAMPEPTQVSFDAAMDRLTARRLLRSQAAGQAWLRRDPRGFDHAVASVVQAAHAFARAAAALAPTEREAWRERGRGVLGLAAGPGGMERWLARVAFEWAAVSAPPSSDRLFGLSPSAWVAVQAGGPDPLTHSLLQAATAPCLLLDADVALDDPFADVAAQVDASEAVCDDFEAEAQRAAAEVIACLNAGTRPIALVAQDRLLMRRVRALLARQQVPLFDETGWKLSTTRAGATLAALLRAAQARAKTDDWLDWLKCCAGTWPGRGDASLAVQMLEATMRKKGWVAVASVDAQALPERAATLWQSAQDVVAGLRAARQRSFGGWLAAMRAALDQCGALEALLADDAGRQALAALHLAEPVVPGADDRADAMTLDEFAGWVESALEEASFIPRAQDVNASDAPVVVTPLSSALLRPFAAVVLAGADEKRLGATPPPHPLLTDAVAAELGLPTSSARRDEELLAFVQLLRASRVSILRRRDDGGEALAASPLVERLRLAMARRGRAMAPAADATARASLEPRAVARPMPFAPDLLPHTLSASACEALRTCPYRFFALRMLGLSEAEELDDAVEKRDYGIWLHTVLHRFHETRGETPAREDQEDARLHAIAAQVQEEMHLDEAAFLPYAASFARFAPRYLQWLRARDAEGAQWLEGERKLTARPPEWGGVAMEGVIDRIDSVHGEQGPVTQLIDYKTGSGQNLRDLVRRPQEDTQLAFYAALMAQQSQAGGELSAIYLPLDDAEGIREVEHKDVEATGRQLVPGIAFDLKRLREGTPMPALGEGRACEFCEARGLCRRDHWTPGEP